MIRKYNNNNDNNNNNNNNNNYNAYIALFTSRYVQKRVTVTVTQQ